MPFTALQPCRSRTRMRRSTPVTGLVMPFTALQLKLSSANRFYSTWVTGLVMPFTALQQPLDLLRQKAGQSSYRTSHAVYGIATYGYE